MSVDDWTHQEKERSQKPKEYYRKSTMLREALKATEKNKIYIGVMRLKHHGRHFLFLKRLSRGSAKS